MRQITLLCLLCTSLLNFSTTFPLTRPTMHELTELSVPIFVPFTDYTYFATQLVFPNTLQILNIGFFIKLILLVLTALSLLLRLVLSPIMMVRYVRFDHDLTCLSRRTFANSSFSRLTSTLFFTLMIIHVMI